MAGKWVTVKEGAEIVGRSHHTVYNWIERTRTGRADPPLVIRRSDKENGKGWLVLVSSLFEVEKLSPRAARPRVRFRPDEANGEESATVELPFNNARSCFSGGDTMKRVRTDRRKWVNGWVSQGKPLSRILAVFSPSLHSEIEFYYCQALLDEEQKGGDE